ncbi:MAG: hypothetical protein FJ034_07655 [Chloroflexi bacterium]|nr:hypothetical protein [Chloroflexota bacterium]
MSVLIRNSLPFGIVLDLDGAELFTSAEWPTAWPLRETPLPSAAALRERAVASHVRDNVLPVFDRVNEEVRVAHNLLLATLAEQIDQFGELAWLGFEGAARARFVEDRDALQFGATLPGAPGPNPLRGLLSFERVDGYRQALEVRNVCCAQFVVKSRPITWCRTCNLITQEQRQ